MILVTGGTGFLGAYIIQDLVQNGYRVRVLRRSKNQPFYIPGAVWEKVEFIDGDVLDIVALQDAMHGVKAIIHAAAIVSFHRSDRAAMYKTNVEGTANMVNAALENNISRFVHISSVAAIGRSANSDIISEDKKWEEKFGHSHYAISKYRSELEVWRGMGEGLDTVVLNPSTILGFGDWSKSSCAIFRNVYREFPWYSNGINGFVDVSDVALAARLLMESNIHNERFIINGDNWSYRDLLFTMADHLHKKRPRREATSMIAEVAWRLERFKSVFNGQRPLLTKESARVAQSLTRFNNSKIQAALPGFRFTPLEETIQKACEKYLQHAGNR